MRTATTIVVVLFLAGLVVGNPLFSVEDVLHSIGKYNARLNAIARVSPTTCGSTVDAEAMKVKARNLVYGSFSALYSKYYRMTGPSTFDFTVGGNFSLGNGQSLISNTTDLLDGLVSVYELLFTYIGSQPSHWMYTTPDITFTTNNQEFGGVPTALAVFDAEERGFTCRYNTDGTAVRAFENSFVACRHMFCYEDNPGTENDGWKICGFYEETTGMTSQSSDHITQIYP